MITRRRFMQGLAALFSAACFSALLPTTASAKTDVSPLIVAGHRTVLAGRAS